MKPGEIQTFKLRTEAGIIKAPGRIISTDKVTADGLPVVEIQFADKVRRYSLLHLL